MATRSKPSSLRRIWQGLLGLMLVLVVAFAVCEWIEWPFLRGPVERALSKGLARPVGVGQDFGVRLLGSVRVRSDRLSIGPDAALPSLRDDQGHPRDFLVAQGVRLALPYGTVFALARGVRDRPIVVSSLDVQRLE